MQTLQPEISISYNIITTFLSEQASQANGKEKDFAKNKTKQETRILAVDPFYRCYFFSSPCPTFTLYKCTVLYKMYRDICSYVCMYNYVCMHTYLFVRSCAKRNSRVESAKRNNYKQ